MEAILNQKFGVHNNDENEFIDSNKIVQTKNGMNLVINNGFTIKRILELETRVIVINPPEIIASQLLLHDQWYTYYNQYTKYYGNPFAYFVKDSKRDKTDIFNITKNISVMIDTDKVDMFIEMLNSMNIKSVINAQFGNNIIVNTNRFPKEILVSFMALFQGKSFIPPPRELDISGINGVIIKNQTQSNKSGIYSINTTRNIITEIFLSGSRDIGIAEELIVEYDSRFLDDTFSYNNKSTNCFNWDSLLNFVIETIKNSDEYKEVIANYYQQGFDRTMGPHSQNRYEGKVPEVLPQYILDSQQKCIKIIGKLPLFRLMSRTLFKKLLTPIKIFVPQEIQKEIINQNLSKQIIGSDTIVKFINNYLFIVGYSDNNVKETEKNIRNLIDNNNNYNELKRSLFCFSDNNNDDCFLCFCEPNPDEGIILPCNHVCCKDCLIQHITLTETEVKCVKTIGKELCNELIPMKYLLLLTYEQIQKKLEKLIDKFVNQSDGNFVYCPKSECGTIHHSSLRLLICDNCSKYYCLNCGIDYYSSNFITHIDVSCMGMKAGSIMDKNTADYLKSNKDTKRCPNCNCFIEKIGGCDHFSCAHCGVHFCWGCGQIKCVCGQRAPGMREWIDAHNQMGIGFINRNNQHE